MRKKVHLSESFILAVKVLDVTQSSSLSTTVSQILSVPNLDLIACKFQNGQGTGRYEDTPKGGLIVDLDLLGVDDLNRHETLTDFIYDYLDHFAKIGKINGQGKIIESSGFDSRLYRYQLVNRGDGAYEVKRRARLPSPIKVHHVEKKYK